MAIAASYSRRAFRGILLRGQIEKNRKCAFQLAPWLNGTLCRRQFASGGFPNSPTCHLFNDLSLVFSDWTHRIQQS